MNFFSFLTVTSLIVIGSMMQLQLVSAELIVRFILSSSGSCTSAERDQITAIFGAGAVVNARRALIRGNETYESRSLSTSTTCRAVCEGKTPCWTTNPRCNGSTGRQRDLNGIEQESGNNDHRAMSAVCDDALRTIHGKLDELRTKVSSSCQTLIGTQATRQTICEDDVKYGSIRSVKLWNVTHNNPSTTKLINSNIPATGLSFCKRMNFSFEAVGDECIDDIDMKLTSPTGWTYNRWEQYPPYYLFGDDNGKIWGSNLASVGLTPTVGQWKLEITPYRLGSLYTNLKKTYTFNINNC